jgi:hypothetical protein
MFALRLVRKQRKAVAYWRSDFVQVSMVVYNGAGMMSSVTTSKPFVVRKANVAGAVRDGRSFTEDLRYSHDKSVSYLLFCFFFLFCF